MSYPFRSPLDSCIYNRYSMLDGQVLFKYDLTLQTNLSVQFSNEKKQYLRTCHHTLVCDKMIIFFFLNTC